jgi:hypothetical protein
MTTPEIAKIPVRSARELTERWEMLLSPPTFGFRSLWLAWFDADGRQTPLVVPIDDIPRRPDEQMLHGLVEVVDSVAREHLGSGAHVAMSLCRPGPGVADADDMTWADSLRTVLAGRLDGTWSLHLAAGGRVTPLVESGSPGMPHP